MSHMATIIIMVTLINTAMVYCLASSGQSGDGRSAARVCPAD
jgi:hypothetical protein